MDSQEYITIESFSDYQRAKIIGFELQLQGDLSCQLWDIVVALIKLQGLVSNGSCFTYYKNEKNRIKNMSFNFYEALYKCFKSLNDFDDFKKEPVDKVYAYRNSRRNTQQQIATLIVEFNSEKNIQKVKKLIDYFLDQQFNIDSALFIECIKHRSFTAEEFEKLTNPTQQLDVSYYESFLKDKNGCGSKKGCLIF